MRDEREAIMTLLTRPDVQRRLREHVVLRLLKDGYRPQSDGTWVKDAEPVD